MGYLTTITIYNDGCDLIKKYPKEFAEKVYDSCLGVYTIDKSSNTFGLGYHGNLVTVQKPRHADDHTIYVHNGNTLVEVNAYSKDFKTLLKNNPDFANKLIKQLKDEVKSLNKLLKENENKS